MKAIGHLMERLAVAEHLAAQKRSSRLGRLSMEQILILDAFFKQIMGLDEVARAARSAELVRGNPKIASALRAWNDPIVTGAKVNRHNTGGQAVVW